MGYEDNPNYPGGGALGSMMRAYQLYSMIQDHHARQQEQALRQQNYEREVKNDAWSQGRADRADSANQANQNRDDIDKILAAGGTQVHPGTPFSELLMPRAQNIGGKIYSRPDPKYIADQTAARDVQKHATEKAADNQSTIALEGVLGPMRSAETLKTANAMSLIHGQEKARDEQTIGPLRTKNELNTQTVLAPGRLKEKVDEAAALEEYKNRGDKEKAFKALTDYQQERKKIFSLFNQADGLDAQAAAEPDEAKKAQHRAAAAAARQQAKTQFDSVATQGESLATAHPGFIEAGTGKDGWPYAQMKTQPTAQAASANKAGAKDEAWFKTNAAKLPAKQRAQFVKEFTARYGRPPAE